MKAKNRNTFKTRNYSKLVIVLLDSFRYLRSHRFSIGFRSGERQGHSMASIRSSSKTTYRLWSLVVGMPLHYTSIRSGNRSED